MSRPERRAIRAIDQAERTIGAVQDGSGFRLFLSHSISNKDLATSIRRDLGPRGVDAFVAHDTIEPTSAWEAEIEAALARCDALAALITPDFINSRWCDQEVGFALGRGVLVVPVRQGAAPHGLIAGVQAVDGDQSDRAAEVISRRLQALLAGHAATGRQMAEPTVRAYATSRSFALARANLEAVRQIPAEQWTGEMLRTVARAGHENAELINGESHGIPIREALAKHLRRLGLGQAPASGRRRPRSDDRASPRWLAARDDPSALVTPGHGDS